MIFGASLGRTRKVNRLRVVTNKISLVRHSRENATT